MADSHQLIHSRSSHSIRHHHWPRYLQQPQCCCCCCCSQSTLEGTQSRADKCKAKLWIHVHTHLTDVTIFALALTILEGEHAMTINGGHDAGRLLYFSVVLLLLCVAEERRRRRVVCLVLRRFLRGKKMASVHHHHQQQQQQEKRQRRASCWGDGRGTRVCALLGCATRPTGAKPSTNQHRFASSWMILFGSMDDFVVVYG